MQLTHQSKQGLPNLFLEKRPVCDTLSFILSGTIATLQKSRA